MSKSKKTISRFLIDCLQAASTKVKSLYLLSLLNLFDVSVKERYFKGRKQLKDRTTCDLGISPERRIFINESLTERNKGLFNESVKTKKDLNISYIWTSNGRIYLRKSQDSSVIPINNTDDLKKLYPS